MRYMRCKCGQRTRYTSMGAGRDCEGCRECQTTYAEAPNEHHDLQPHEWRPSYDERTGEVRYQVCEKCGVADLQEAND